MSTSECMFTLGPSLSICNSVSNLFIHSTFFLWSFRSHILLQNLLGSFASGCPFSLYLLVEFSFVVLERLVLYLALSRYLCSLPSFSRIYLLLFSNFIFRSSYSFSVLSEYILMFRLKKIVCCSLFIWCYSLNSHPGFNFVFVVFRRTRIFSQTNFAPAYI